MDRLFYDEYVCLFFVVRVNDYSTTIHLQVELFCIQVRLSKTICTSALQARRACPPCRRISNIRNFEFVREILKIQR